MCKCVLPERGGSGFDLASRVIPLACWAEHEKGCQPEWCSRQFVCACVFMRVCVLQKCEEEGQCVREPLATTTASCAILESLRRNKQIPYLSEKVSC